MAFDKKVANISIYGKRLRNVPRDLERAKRGKKTQRLFDEP